MSRLARLSLLGLLILPAMSLHAPTAPAVPQQAPQAPPAPALPVVPAFAGTSGETYRQLQLRDERGALLAVAFGDGHVTVLLNGEPLPPEQLLRDGELLSIHDADGALLWTLRVLPGGIGFDFPADATTTYTFAADRARFQPAVPVAHAPPAPSGWNSLFWSDGALPAAGRRRIGITTEAVGPALAAQLGLQPSEVFLVQGVSPGTPAQTAGLQAFDIVVAIDGTPPATTERLREVLAAKGEGETVQLALLRGGQRLELAAGFLPPDPAVSPRAAGYLRREPGPLAEQVVQELFLRRDAQSKARAELVEQARQAVSASGDGADVTPQARAALEAALAALGERDLLTEAWQRELESGGDLLVLGAEVDGDLLTVKPTLTARRGEDDRLAALEQRLARLEELLVAALAARGEDAPPPTPARDGAGTSGEDR